MSLCAPPDPEVKCGGWNVSRGAVQCGAPYQAGSPLCGACAPGFYLPGDGSCVACPAVAGLWSQYRTVILLLCIVLAGAVCVGLALIALVKCYGGSLEGSARLLLGLALWSITALQTVSQAAPASAASLPPLLASIFRGIAVLQLDGVLLPPACTGAYAFESSVRSKMGRQALLFGVRAQTPCRFSSPVQVGVIGAALVLALLYLSALVGATVVVHPLLQTVGMIALRALLLLFPPAARNALALLNCTLVTVSATGCCSLNGCHGSASGPGCAIRPSRGSSVAVSVLASNPYFVCWASGGAHSAAGGLSVVALVLVVGAFPLVSLWAVWRWSVQPKTHRAQLDSRATAGSRRFKDSADVPTVVINPMRQGEMSADTSVGSEACEGPPLLSPFLLDFNADSWYTRHADLALTLILAALQVTRQWLSASVDCNFYHCPQCAGLCSNPHLWSRCHWQSCSNNHTHNGSLCTCPLGAPLRHSPCLEGRREGGPSGACSSVCRSCCLGSRS